MFQIATFYANLCQYVLWNIELDAIYVKIIVINYHIIIMWFYLIVVLVNHLGINEVNDLCSLYVDDLEMMVC